MCWGSNGKQSIVGSDCKPYHHYDWTGSTRWRDGRTTSDEQVLLSY